MRLKRLIEQVEGLVVRGSREGEISGLCADSRLVAPGDLFVARRGEIHDGTHYILDAIQAGAVAVLTDLYDPFLEVPQLIHPDVPSIEAQLASHFFHNPSHSLKMVGITGTNGKSTTAFLLKAILDKQGAQAGLIGTIEWVVGSHRFPGKMTTPEAITTHKLLREMVNVGCKAAIMEVSSHALDQNRVGEVDFDIGLLTSFSQDHLDYHGSMEAYKEAKMRLFTGLKEGGWAIYNQDEPFIPVTKGQLMSYGLEKEADLMAKNVQLSEKGILFTACHEGEEQVCKSDLIGRFNVYNLLAAIAASLKCGISLEEATRALKTCRAVPGRLERVRNKRGLSLFVDYAHSPDALEKILNTLSPFKKGKLITVFGCGGDRDQNKRAKMGEVVERGSDLAIVTSDNPRSEDPQAIADGILKGMTQSSPLVELDRKKAIEKAVQLAEKGDIILIAGKGHEKEQIFARQVVPFDDVQVAQKALEEIALV